MIPVYKTYEKKEIIGEVMYNQNLDYWDGNGFTCGSKGRHKGLEKLNDDYVLIHGTQWDGEKDYGVIITPEQATQEILRSGNIYVFEGYDDLQKIREELSQKNKKNEKIIIRISETQKKLWQCKAELEGKNLSEFIISKVEK